MANELLNDFLDALALYFMNEIDAEDVEPLARRWTETKQGKEGAVGHSQPPDKLEWETPPPGVPKKGSKWDPIARALRQHPGQWACLGRAVNTGIVSTINNAGLKCFRPEGAYEAVARNHVDRWTADVYARYVGSHGEHA